MATDTNRSDRERLTATLADLKALDERLGSHGHILDSCHENLEDMGQPEPDHGDDGARADWVRELILMAESCAEAEGII